ncbi:MAG: hypothetical protein GY866_13125, partial [Proteobacteria bacterium]|nr:hypothetical protein [Pseudomonadota bacterium]
DESEIIGDTALEYSKRVTWVFTSGGIGPTPDDITMESLASAFDVPLVTNPVLVELIKKMYGGGYTNEHLRMARVPKGTRLLPTSRTTISVLQFKNIIIFPGVPEFMRAMFELVRDRFQGVVKPVKEICLMVDEGEITGSLQKTLESFPEMKIGSYPSFLDEGCRVKIVMEHENEDYLQKGYDYLVGQVAEYIRSD